MTDDDDRKTAEPGSERISEDNADSWAGAERTETTRDSTTRSMTETPTDASETHADAPETETTRTTTGGNDRENTASNPRFDRLSTDNLRGILDRIGLAALVLLALIAGWSFYSQAGRAIRTWLDPAYQPIALAAFNLAILFVALAGVAHQLYRIRRSERTEESVPEPRGE